MTDTRHRARPGRLSRIRALLCASAAFPLTVAGALAADLEADLNWLSPPSSDTAPAWNAWASLGGAWNSDTESFGEFVIFAPFWQDSDSLLFAEARGRYFEDDLLAGNAALGIRQMTDSGFNLGAWLGLDVFQSVSDNTFGQVSGGIEALSTWFDFRANGYLPFTDPQKAADGLADVILTGPDAFRRGEIYMIGGKEVAAYGADAEAGFRLPFGNNIGHLGVYGGGYWYDADELNEAVTGGMARLELAFNDVLGAGSRVTALYRYTDDNVNGGNHLVGGALRIPLGKAPAGSAATPTAAAAAMARVAMPPAARPAARMTLPTWPASPPAATASAATAAPAEPAAPAVTVFTAMAVWASATFSASHRMTSKVFG